MYLRVERLALRLDRLDALAREHAAEIRQNEADALGEAIAAGRVRQRALQVVDDREQLADQSDASARAGRGDVLRRALAVVLEVGLRALGEVEVLVAIALGDGELVLRRLVVARRCRRPFASALVGRTVVSRWCDSSVILRAPLSI